ncbi:MULTISPECIES: helix-turn-helix domain-containing protein [Methylomonas]
MQHRTDNLDKLCAYFHCRIEDLVEYVSEDLLTGSQNVNPKD